MDDEHAPSYWLIRWTDSNGGRIYMTVNRYLTADDALWECRAERAEAVALGSSYLRAVRMLEQATRGSG